MFVDPDGMVPLSWPVFWWIGRALATQKGREVVATEILAVATVTTVAINSDKFPTIDLPVRRDGIRSDVQLNPMWLNSNKKDTKEIREKATIGQEAHRQEQKKIREEGGDTEVSMELKDGTIVIIKLNAKFGRASAKKREELLDKNEEMDFLFHTFY